VLVIASIQTRYAPGFLELEREMQISTRMNLNELAERMGDSATLVDARIMRNILTSDSRVRDIDDTADIPDELWQRFLTASALDESPRNQHRQD
jgi:hypothetical protein